jgi:hypothetical protein
MIILKRKGGSMAKLRGMNKNQSNYESFQYVKGLFLKKQAEVEKLELLNKEMLSALEEDSYNYFPNIYGISEDKEIMEMCSSRSSELEILIKKVKGI